VATPRAAEAALALANAHQAVGNFQSAQALLDRPDLAGDPALRQLYLRVHALTQADLSTELERRSPAADRALMAALEDYRALAALEPDDVEHRFAVAEGLSELGAYDKAEAAFRAILGTWPAEEFRVTIRLGALQRLHGDYRQALDTLNQLVARNGPQEGMRFHYHRAWTLSLLGRYDEAIRDLSEGLKDQPDFASAYLRRACAYASIGRIREALADAEEARSLLAALSYAATAKVIKDDNAEAEGLRDRFSAALAAGADGKPITGTCRGSVWEEYERPRPRSRLLPRA
jgi:tetratricopeptide (TPR) repeat protein